ncbi:MAG: GtrA family protein [Solobacterium sp.]|nr:GtrA family protein [Solobacterium sp.]
MKEFLRFIRFTLISASAGLIELGSFTLSNEIMHWPYWLSYMIALTLSVVWNFTLNRKYTFKSAADIPSAMFKAAMFYVFFLPASTWLEHYLTGLGINEYIVTIGNMLLNFVLEFLYQRYYVFRDSLDTNV